MLTGLEWVLDKEVVVADALIALVIGVECLNPVVDAKREVDVLSAKRF